LTSVKSEQIYPVRDMNEGEVGEVVKLDYQTTDLYFAKNASVVENENASDTNTIITITTKVKKA
jgi:hypothetical protein